MLPTVGFQLFLGHEASVARGGGEWPYGGRCLTRQSYKDLNPIEREIRKRVFWLLYGGDKTDAAVDNQPVFLHEVDCSDVTLPSPL